MCRPSALFCELVWASLTWVLGKMRDVATSLQGAALGKVAVPCLVCVQVLPALMPGELEKKASGLCLQSRLSFPLDGLGVGREREGKCW